MMRLIKKRLDYKPLKWLPEDTNLEFLIFEDYTIVKSQIIFKKNKSNIIKKFSLNNTIELNGLNLITKKFLLIIDEIKTLNIKIDNLKQNNEIVSIPIPDNANSLKISTEVKIFPKDNSSLEGLYETNNMFCTQCEPEGFRKITWFPDRPDCLSKFTVKIETSNKFNTLISNGNLIEEGSKKNERHFKLWHDPFPKPSYLFALVVGNLEFYESNFTTFSNRKITIRIFTELGNKSLTKYAMKSLKNAMSWDEKKYGLEYDLDTFMIVAVSHFNMGAMENKGLNIFNSKFILADDKTATDSDFKNIEAIVAHEYFHNWTGNRITCRDWFQLTLKEGLTVFRDQEFSADMNQKGVKRIEDVLLLRSIQFPEDAGSNCHPIRPESYFEINNFYTPTVYEKGAEVIRMISNYLGEKRFRKGMDVYFKSYDGKAVTCENFIDALTKGSKLDLKIFKKWYSQPGTPTVNICREIKSSGIKLNFFQRINDKKTSLPLPIKISFLNKEGNFVKFKLNNSKLSYEHVYLLTKCEDSVKVTTNEINLVPSLLREFSAPVILETDLNVNEYIHILKFDNDSFNRWDAIQNLYLDCFRNKSTVNYVTKSLKDLLLDKSIDFSLMALFLELPSRNSFEKLLEIVDPIDVYLRKIELTKSIAKNLQDILEKLAFKIYDNGIENNESIGERAFLEKILKYLMLIDSEIGTNISKKIATSSNMTLSIAGLKCLCLSDKKVALKYLNNFYLKWSNNDLVLEKWFEMMSSLNFDDEGINYIKKLMEHKSFDIKNPNKLRSVLGTFQKENILLFHAEDSSGYNFISEQISIIDKRNPQVAARLILPLTRFKNYNEDRKNKIKKVLKNISDKKPSNDLTEIIEKALN